MSIKLQKGSSKKTYNQGIKKKKKKDKNFDFVIMCVSLPYNDQKMLYLIYQD